MTTPLPPFSGDRPTCTKCGHDAASVRHTPDFTMAFPRSRGVCSGVGVTGIGERLCRECLRCSWHWDEATAVHADAVPEDERVPLGQQFDTSVIYGIRASHVLLRHNPSGLDKTLVCGTPGAADSAVHTLHMFQYLLDDVDRWGRMPIGSSCSPGVEETVPNNLEGK